MCCRRLQHFGRNVFCVQIGPTGSFCLAGSFCFLFFFFQNFGFERRLFKHYSCTVHVEFHIKTTLFHCSCTMPSQRLLSHFSRRNFSQKIWELLLVCLGFLRLEEFWRFTPNLFVLKFFYSVTLLSFFFHCFFILVLTLLIFLLI